MYIIEPYKSIGNLLLNSTPFQIGKLLGNASLNSSIYAPTYLTGIYRNGITVSYKDNLVVYIGVHIILNPIHLDFSFMGKSYTDVLNYFKVFPKCIYIENDVSIISEYLGIGIYFEDGIKEVSIFSENYGKEIMNGLECI